MEITPHYTLNLEEEAERLEREARMAVFFQQLAAVQDAGWLSPDGTVRSTAHGSNSSDWTPKNGWQGRSANTKDNNEGSNSPGGRNFKVGKINFDPALFGITESDPDYHAYLTGAKLPPAFLDMLAKYNRGDQDWDSQLIWHSSNEYGKYGRQAEKPAFQPAWAKLKLRSTNHGQLIRKGVYDEASPVRPTRRVAGDDSPPALSSIPAPPVSPPSSPQPQALPPPSSSPAPPSANAMPESAPEQAASAYYAKKTTTVIRTTPASDPNAEPVVETTTTTTLYAQGDVDAFAPPAEQFAALEMQPQHHHQQHYHQDDQYEDEEYYEEDEEEYVEDEEYYEDDAAAVVNPAHHESLSDLQAILAAKQAELRRLQGLS
jgi:hypothetical protein